MSKKEMRTNEEEGGILWLEKAGDLYQTFCIDAWSSEIGVLQI